ncbi:MAG: DnaJ domain-containing protein [Proteobacteria bacterium]|nr:DnaJ domain-containing protein [Pseudomonadota bacterium]
MLTTVSGTDLVRACQILFSPDASCSLSFVKSLDPLTLKTAFRKKALETHPDRSRALGKHEADQSRRFLEVKMAYEVLLPLAEKSVAVTEKKRATKRHPNQDRERETRFRDARSRMSSYYRGVVPTQELKFGQFLYYSGIITWRQLIDAISFQRCIKPRYGQIAREWNIIDLHQVVLILQNKNQDERFGEYARKCGFITGFQHLAILGKQRQFHRLFGEYFVNEGILSQRQLDIAVKQAMFHNQSNQ